MDDISMIGFGFYPAYLDAEGVQVILRPSTTSDQHHSEANKIKDIVRKHSEFSIYPIQLALTKDVERAR
ncbi:hypothetical protein CVT26_010436 [Gymnopilus dilepis]|uniref:Uncharacterized protein n=1 Tax=Gymnopilus dilepis TaxID=231916 RepID=A0A409Y0I3_9AGAR|nr:hypothetical protein CVT26_010436 [Gymnopilus dilepis]